LTDPASFGPTHPVTRLGRVVQQMRSFGDLHAAELESLAGELDHAQLMESAAKVRAFASMQRDEARLVVDELADIQTDLSTAAAAGLSEEVPTEEAPAEAWKSSPKRAAWLAEQTRPRTRRDLFSR
jgi:hypothetical protein